MRTPRLLSWVGQVVEPMLLVTDFWRSFPEQWTAASGLRGRTVAGVETLRGCLKYCDRPDVVFLLNATREIKLVYELAGAFLTRPWLRRPLIAVDTVLRAPERALDYAKLPFKRFLISRVDHHILYFRDLKGYQKWFGVGPAKCTYVPFKVNIPFPESIERYSQGEYVLCFGRSQRDWGTFFGAMRQVPYPGAVSRSSLPASYLSRAGSIPANVRVLDEEGTPQSQIPLLNGARLVALPILKSNIAASGLSTCFNAMALGKCVIGTEGPGFTDIFSNEVLAVPAGDPTALAAMIRGAWENDALREETAMRGHEYVRKTGGRDDLYQRIIDAVGEWRSSLRGGGRPALA